MPHGRPADDLGCLIAVLAAFGLTLWALGSLLWHGLRAVLGF